MLRLRFAIVVGLLLAASSASAQFRNESDTVAAVAKAYPELLPTCGAFVDQVAHRLNRKDGVVRWGRKARQQDGGNPNCDGLTYLNDPTDRSKKTIVDIIESSESPNAKPSWQVFAGDNVGNGFWTEPKTADRDHDHQPPPPVDPPPTPTDPGPAGGVTADQVRAIVGELLDQKLAALKAELETHDDQNKAEILARFEQIRRDLVDSFNKAGGSSLLTRLLALLGAAGGIAGVVK